MCKFVQPIPDYYDFVNHLYLTYTPCLEDDYNQDTLADIILRTYPYFWVILTHNNEPVGFVYLDNIIGNKNRFHSAEVVTCLHQKFWGSYSKYCAKIFFKQCFDKFGFEKIKALIYPQNSKVKTLLKLCGFEKEALLKHETKRKNKLQDIEIYSLFSTYYKEKENEN